jgi:hypothetical protein
VTGPAEEPTREQPAVTPTVSTDPPSRWRRHWSVIPSHLGRARTSTLVLAVLFLAIGALYLNVRPAPPGTPAGDTGVQQPVDPPTQAPPTTAPATTSTAPTTTAETSPSTTAPTGPTTTETSGSPTEPTSESSTPSTPSTPAPTSQPSLPMTGNTLATTNSAPPSS